MQQHITVARRHLTEHKTDDHSQTVVVSILCFVSNSLVVILSFVNLLQHFYVINVKKNCCVITMCKAHGKVTHIKQQKYFHHRKGRGYNTRSLDRHTIV